LESSGGKEVFLRRAGGTVAEQCSAAQGAIVLGHLDVIEIRQGEDVFPVMFVHSACEAAIRAAALQAQLDAAERLNRDLAAQLLEKTQAQSQSQPTPPSSQKSKKRHLQDPDYRP
jgi:dsRNA-specific ribonuclease